MKKIIVCFLVLLAVCSLSLTLVPGAFSQTENVKVLNYSYYIDSLGLLVVVGQVQNVGSNTVASVLLTGTVSSSDGSQVNSGTEVWVKNLTPQQKAPFYMEFYSRTSSDGSWTSDVSKVAISVYQANATANYQYPDLKITSNQYSIGGGSDDKGVFWVNGEIQNTGSQTAKNVRVIGTFYNASGAVVAVGGYINEVVTTSLSASGTASFKFGAFDLNQTGIVSDKKITDYSLLIQVEAPILQGTAPAITPTPSPGPVIGATPTPTDSSSSGQGSQSDSTGSSSSTQWIYAVVVVVAIVAVVAG
jgi:hypothetical protein